MNLISFEDHLDRYGGDLARWPAEIRAAAVVFLEATPEARGMLRAMEDVEAVLRAKLTPLFAVDRIAAIATRETQLSSRRWLTRKAAGWSAAAVFALFLGCMLGGIVPQQHDESPEVVVAASLDASGAIDVD